MATKAAIAIETQFCGEYTVISRVIESDGYLDIVGKELHSNYSQMEDAWALVNSDIYFFVDQEPLEMEPIPMGPQQKFESLDSWEHQMSNSGCPYLYVFSWDKGWAYRNFDMETFKYLSEVFGDHVFFVENTPDVYYIERSDGKRQATSDFVIVTPIKIDHQIHTVNLSNYEEGSGSEGVEISVDSIPILIDRLSDIHEKSQKSK
jgi:hypothetical protein